MTGLLRELLAAWARAKSTGILLSEYVVDKVTDGDEKSNKTVRFMQQVERLAHELRRELGLTPASEANVARSRGDAVKGSSIPIADGTRA